LPASTAERDRAADAKQVAARDGGSDAGRPADGDRANGRPRDRQTQPGAGIGDPSSTPERRERVGTPRGLRAPQEGAPGGGAAPDGGGSGGGGGGGGGSGPVTVPELPPSGLPDPRTVLEPVTDLLPPVQTPVPVPAPPLPAPTPPLRMPAPPVQLPAPIQLP
jgi:hypothetical protein